LSDQISISFIIPVYNRPEEIGELLESFKQQETNKTYEIVIVEDGSTQSSDAVIETYAAGLDISYFFKENSGPGDSRNYGMRKAEGNYFIILDSDCILPKHYVQTAYDELAKNYIHCFGGPDAAHVSFSNLQKAINYSMTSFLTTGGIRGGKKQLDKFQPRSFNMGLSREAFETTEGFGDIHPGEDPDLVLRLWGKGYDTKLIAETFVYHKRRISWKKFYKQVRKFGLVRPILNSWHPASSKLTYWFPTVFVLGCIIAGIMAILGNFIGLLLFAFYLILIGVHASLTTKSLTIGIQAMPAVLIQFFGYGLGFLESSIAILVFKKLPRKHFPQLFFN